MRIALVTYALYVGGMESFLFALARGLRARGMDVEFVISEDIGEWHDRPAREAFVTHAVLPSSWHGRHWHARKVLQKLHSYDVLLLNHARAAQAVTGIVSEQTAIIAVLHNDIDHIYRVGLSAAHNLDAIVCVGPRVRAEAAHRGAPESRTLLIPYGVPVPQRWPKADEATADRPLRVLFLGRVHDEQKGVFFLPSIVALATAMGCRLRFDLIGEGPDLPALRTQFGQQCPDLDVHLHGALPHDHAMRTLAESDVLLMPSRYEGLPIALLEAMARGVVPVASLLPGITDFPVRHGQSGLLLPVGDVEGFAAALVELADAPRRRRMSEAAWADAHEQFSEERMCQHYADLIARTVADRRAGRSPPRNHRVETSLFGIEYYVPSRILEGARKVRRACPAARALFAG